MEPMGEPAPFPPKKPSTLNPKICAVEARKLENPIASILQPSV